MEIEKEKEKEKMFKHFSHDHELILNEEKKHGAEELVRNCKCNGCLEQIVSAPYYSCSQSCGYFLHKLCTELPPEMSHPAHPVHRLTLLAKPTWGTCRCDVCGRRRWENFTYHCDPCDFDVDVICALLERKIKECHKHPLTQLERPVLSFCDACGEEHKGKFYLCITCQFWIHRNCASLPSTVQHNDHNHPLTLTHSLPYEFSTCVICDNYLISSCWVYHCHNCKFVAHVNCAASKTEPFMSILLPDLKNKVSDDPSLIHLPMLGSIISQFSKMNLQGESNKAKELNRQDIHNHALILVEEQSNDELCSESKLCNVCVQPISTPFYKCPDSCYFFIHKWCAELPTEMQHPFHRHHPIVLLQKCPQFFDLFKCEGCGFFCNGFAYGCRNCEYFLDVYCACLLNTITHVAHAQHRLILTRKRHFRCNACPERTSWWYRRFGYECATCDFKIHPDCALLPREVKHRYDEDHPLTLTYSPIEDNSDEYFCEICEEDLDTNKWFYHFRDDDYVFYFHINCAHPLISKIKFGGTVEVDGHPHHLILHGRAKKDTFRCDHCRRDFNKLFFFVCSQSPQCKYKLHYKCAVALANKHSY